MWTLVTLGGLWVGVLLLWSAGVVNSSASAAYLFAIAAGVVFVARAVQTTSSPRDGWRTARKALVLGLLAAVPPVFDSSASDHFNAPKYALVSAGAFGLMGLWIIGSAYERRPVWWTHGLHWPVLALVGWTAVTTATSVNPRFSALGSYASYDGLFAAVAFATVLFVTAEAFRLRDLKAALTVLYLVGGGLVVLYGLIQMHDRLFGGRDWDWVGPKGGAVGSSIRANFGNPNHLAAFLAVIFPIGLVLLLLHRSPWIRVLIGLVSLAGVAQLVYTGSRGAWLAAFVATTTLIVLLAREARRRPGAFVSLALACVAVTSVTLLAPSETLSHKLDPEQLSASGDTSVKQRIEFWKAATRMANDRPLLGVGPDAFEPRFFAYQSAEFAEMYGTRITANGAHNIFLNQLATQGYPGLVALVVLLASAGALAVSTWRSLRRQEGDGGGGKALPKRDVELRRLAQEGRLAVTAIACGLVAYVIQATFNVQKIALSFLFWVLLGMLCVAARAADVTGIGLSRRAGPAEDVGAPVGIPLLDGQPDGRRGGDRRPRRAPRRTRQAALYGVAAVFIAGLIPLGRFAAGPWQADRAYREAVVADTARRTASSQSDARRFTQQMFQALERAQKLNPWEPRYFVAHALEAVSQASAAPAGSQMQRDLLDQGQGMYERVIRGGPGGTSFLSQYGEALLRLHQRDPSVGQARDQAVRALQRAHRVSPHDPEISALLDEAEQS